MILGRRQRATRLSKAAAAAARAGDEAAAEAGWREAVALREAAGAGGHDDQRADQCCLAGLLVRLDRPAEAAPFARAAIEGPQADTLHARWCIASIVEMLCETGRAEAAEPLARALLNVLASAPETRGTDEHAHALTQLAAVLTVQGREEEAEAVLRQAIEVTGICAGPDHPNRAGLILWIAGFHQKRDDLAGAESLCREALDIQLRSLGGEDAAVAETRMRLSLLLDRAGRSEDAVGILRQALAILSKQPDGFERERAEALGHLAGLLNGLGRDGEAEPLWRERRALLAAAPGRDHPDYRTACAWLADALTNLGRPEEAEPLLREVLDLARSGDGPAATRAALAGLGWHLVQAGRPEEAEPLYREALSITGQAFGRGPEFSEALDNLGWMIGSAGRYEEAEAIHRDALLLRSRAPGCASEPYCNSFTNLAWVLWRKGRPREAEAELDAGLEAMRAESEPGDARFLWALDKVATACRDEGSVDAARRHFSELRELLTETFGPTDPRTEAATAELAGLDGPRRHAPLRLQ